MGLNLSTSMSLAGSTLPVHISSQSQHSIFESVYSEIFSCSALSLCSVFDFSRNYRNLYFFSNSIAFSIAIVFIVFVIISFFKKISFSPTESLLNGFWVDENLKNDFIPLFISLFFARSFQFFDDKKKTLTVSDSSEFTDTYKIVT